MTTKQLNESKSIKPYRITRKYYNNNVIKTYEHHYATLDRVYKAITTIIDESEHYHFDLHRLCATKHDDSKLVCELRNESKPCIIPIKDLLSNSYLVDPKYSGVK